MSDNSKDFFLSIMEHISIIKSTIKAATPASMPFSIATIIGLVIKIL